MPRARRFKIVGDGERPVAIEVLLAAGWTQVPSGNDWDLCWNLFAPGPSAFKGINGRRFNHLIGSRFIGIKDGLHRTLTAASAGQEARGRAREFDFAPRTFLVPEDEAQLLELVARSPASVFIEKPRVGARGEGVRMLAKAQDGKRDGTTLVQEYLARPHLIDGYKYSLRFYLLVTSVEPLIAWLYDDGFVKLASRQFSLEGKNQGDRFRHLTNPDVLQHDKATPVSSRNLTHRAYRQRLAAAGTDVALLWRRIHALAARTIAAAQGPMALLQRRERLSNDGCFELFGLDVMLDAGMIPWLLEVNISPSLGVHADKSTPKAREEAELKSGLMRDTFQLIDLERELGPAPQPGATVNEVRRYHSLLLKRRGAYHPLVPGPDSFALLPLLGACGPGDFALALGERGGQTPLRPERARAYPLDRGLVVQADEVPALLSLDADVAELWRSMEERRSPDRATWALAQAVPDLAQAAEGLVWTTLATWAHERAIAPDGAPELDLSYGPIPSLEWNREQRFEVMGLSFLLRLCDESWDQLVLPTLAPFRCPAGRAPQAAFEARIARGSIIVEDERGYQHSVASIAHLPGAIHAAVARRAALHAGYLGSLRALVVEARGKHALLLGASRALGARANVLTGEPALFARARTLTVRHSSRPDAAALELQLIARVRTEAAPAEDERAALLEDLLAARIAPVPPISAEGAGALTAWLQSMRCTQLLAPDVDSALAALGRELA